MTCNNQLEVSIHLRKIATYIQIQLRSTGGPHSVGVGPSKMGVHIGVHMSAKIGVKIG